MTIARAALFVALALASAACSDSSYERIKGPNGFGEWYLVTCEDRADSCYERASSLCPRGYYAHNKRFPRGWETSGVAAMGGNVHAITREVSLGGSMKVECRGEPDPDEQEDKHTESSE
jgi:hypothetical protein